MSPRSCTVGESPSVFRNDPPIGQRDCLLYVARDLTACLALDNPDPTLAVTENCPMEGGRFRSDILQFYHKRIMIEVWIGG